MWLEVDKDNIIIGVHSDRCDSDDTWVESDDPNVMPGDAWKKGKVIRVREKQTREEKAAAKQSERRRQAYVAITHHYPEWQQLNILRGGDAEQIKNMGHFIDAVRAWSNAPSVPEKNLQSIQDEFFPNNNKNIDKTAS